MLHACYTNGNLQIATLCTPFLQSIVIMWTLDINDSCTVRSSTYELRFAIITEVGPCFNHTFSKIFGQKSCVGESIMDRFTLLEVASALLSF